MLYIGKTQICEHKYSTVNNDEKSPVARHSYKKKYMFLDSLSGHWLELRFVIVLFFVILLMFSEITN